MMVGFMASRTGRWTRILVGSSLVVGGLAADSVKGRVMALVTTAVCWRNCRRLVEFMAFGEADCTRWPP